VPRTPRRRGPRERLRERGTESLDDAELLALLLRTGARGRPAEQLARELLGGSGLHGLARALPAELERQPGVGPAKAATLLAALELGRRLAQRRLHTGDAIRGPQDVFRHFHARLRDAQHEQFHLLLLDGRHRLLREVMASRGTLTASLVHPREVFRPALREGAAALVVVHNHPSGDPAPSVEDREVTRRLVQAGALLGVPLLDHVVVAERGWVSLREQGELETLPWGESPARA
jgi:DNA repair protein RadC